MKSESEIKGSVAKGPAFSDSIGFDTCGDPQLERLVDACASFWGSVLRQDAPRWLVLVGETGTGKTHLARKLGGFAGMLCRMHNQGDRDLGPRQEGKSYASRFFSWPKVVSGFFRGDYGIIEDMRDEWFVVIDDIGATRAKMDDLVIDQLFQVLDGRHDKWTVLTTNKSLPELAQLDVRIHDRLMRRKSQVVMCETVSYSLR